MNLDKIKSTLLDDGYCVIENYVEIPQSALVIADSLMRDYSYKVGRSYKTDNPFSLPPTLLSLVYNENIKRLFEDVCPTIGCRDVFITHEYKNEEMERNNWLHFDRLRCLKAMVYLTDVNKNCGPLSVVPGSHRKGSELRNSFKNAPSYEEKKNRIEIDYPELEVEFSPLTGSAGTLILFDTDTFHKGGDVLQHHERKIIRSHWYPDYAWRVGS